MESSLFPCAGPFFGEFVWRAQQLYDDVNDAFFSFCRGTVALLVLSLCVLAEFLVMLMWVLRQFPGRKELRNG
jgi:hypothetical protein